MIPYLFYRAEAGKGGKETAKKKKNQTKQKVDGSFH